MNDATVTASAKNGSAPILEHSARGLTRRLPGVARVLMGALFLMAGSFGLAMAAGLVSPPPPGSMPAGAADFMMAMAKTGYMFWLLKLTEAAVGLLLLSNRFVPLALAAIAPVVVNIVAFHAFLAPSGLAVPVVLLGLEVALAWAYRGAFRSVLAARARPEAA
jgi:hypothetical protein